MAGEIEAAKAAAKKVLGDKAKIPAPKPVLSTAADQANKAFLVFDKAREDLEAKLLALQNTQSSWKNALEQYADALEASDFDLDPKDKDDAKKIEQAQKIFADWAKNALDILDENVKNLDELDKHMMNITKYKPKA
jgi:hypothetical protein